MALYHAYIMMLQRLLDNSPTNQLAASHVADWSSCGLYSQLAETFDLKFAVNNSSKCYFW